MLMWWVRYKQLQNSESFPYSKIQWIGATNFQRCLSFSSSHILNASNKTFIPFLLVSLGGGDLQYLQFGFPTSPAHISEFQWHTEEGLWAHIASIIVFQCSNEFFPQRGNVWGTRSPGLLFQQQMNTVLVKVTSASQDKEWITAKHLATDSFLEKDRHSFSRSRGLENLFGRSIKKQGIINHHYNLLPF